jgi:hypothetical protein
MREKTLLRGYAVSYDLVINRRSAGDLGFNVVKLE